MKKVLRFLKTKCTMVNVANMLALAMVISTVNSTCFWAHHQPEVPEAALKFKRS